MASLNRQRVIRSRTRCWRRRISESTRGSGPPTWPN